MDEADVDEFDDLFGQDELSEHKKLAKTAIAAKLKRAGVKPAPVKRLPPAYTCTHDIGRAAEKIQKLMPNVLWVPHPQRLSFALPLGSDLSTFGVSEVRQYDFRNIRR